MARASGGDTRDKFGSFEYENVGSGVGIRSSPAYPGERTGAAVESGEVHQFKAQCIVPHTLGDGQQHDIYFYELADGRGWVHDFDPDKGAGHRTIKVLLDLPLPVLRSAILTAEAKPMADVAVLEVSEGGRYQGGTSAPNATPYNQKPTQQTNQMPHATSYTPHTQHQAAHATHHKQHTTCHARPTPRTPNPHNASLDTTSPPHI